MSELEDLEAKKAAIQMQIDQEKHVPLKEGELDECVAWMRKAVCEEQAETMSEWDRVWHIWVKRHHEMASWNLRLVREVRHLRSMIPAAPPSEGEA